MSEIQDENPTGMLSGPSFWEPQLVVDSAWIEHTPFAFWIIDALRPRRLVELGAHNGQSYLAFCQAIDRLDLNTSAFAVDTWEGDVHSGTYGAEVLRDLRLEHDSRYARFSQLLQMTFAEAAGVIEDGTVDLLHIDGRHFEDDAWEDFNIWESKLSAGAVVLMHDTQVRERGFGVYKVWAEIRTRYPSFEFTHGHGLGVLAIGEVPESIQRLTQLRGDGVSQVRAAFARLGACVGAELHRILDTADLERRLAEQALHADNLNQHANNLNIIIDARDLQIQDLQDAVEQIQTVATQRADELQNVQERARRISVKERTKRQAAERRLADLRASKSWRITKPLRGVPRSK